MLFILLCLIILLIIVITIKTFILKGLYICIHLKLKYWTYSMFIFYDSFQDKPQPSLIGYQTTI